MAWPTVADRAATSATEIYAPFNGRVHRHHALVHRGGRHRSRWSERAMRRSPGLRVPLAERARVFIRYHDLVLERLDPSSSIFMQIEGGKSRQPRARGNSTTSQSTRATTPRTRPALLRPRSGARRSLPLLVQGVGIPNHPFGAGGYHRALELPASPWPCRMRSRPSSLERRRAKACRPHPFLRALRGAPALRGRDCRAISSKS
jgi:hypothetical protein